MNTPYTKSPSIPALAWCESSGNPQNRHFLVDFDDSPTNSNNRKITGTIITYIRLDGDDYCIEGIEYPVYETLAEAKTECEKRFWEDSFKKLLDYTNSLQFVLDNKVLDNKSEPSPHEVNIRWDEKGSRWLLDKINGRLIEHKCSAPTFISINRFLFGVRGLFDSSYVKTMVIHYPFQYTDTTMSEMDQLITHHKEYYMNYSGIRIILTHERLIEEK